MKIWKNDCLWKLPSLSTVLKIRHGFRKNPLHGFSSFVLIVSGNILIPNFDPLAWPSSAPACYTPMLLMFTQHSPQSKQSAQLCNMTRVATRSRWRWPQPVLAWVIQPRHNPLHCTSLQSGCIPVTSGFGPIGASTDLMVNYYKSRHRRIKL